VPLPPLIMRPFMLEGFLAESLSDGLLVD